MYDPLRAQDAVIARLKALHPNLIDLTTGRIERLLAALGRPQDRLPPVIHVAGTNGKGSTVAFLRAIAEAAGLRVHVLTSPHLVRFVERIRVAGTLLTEDALAGLIDRAEAANDGLPISFFEMATAIALLAFAEAPADLCLIEVGLGGRYDATNVFVRPAVTVITPVDYDHLEMLGPELSKIAWEKAGILRAGAPGIVARQADEALAVIEAEAEAVGAPLTLMGRDFDAFEERGRLRVQMEDRLLDLPAPGLFGGFQFDNAGLAVAAILALGDARINDAAIAEGVAGATWPARFQRLTAGPLAARAKARGASLWLDGGHNPHAGRALAATIGRLQARDARPVTLIAAMFARKDARGFFAPFVELAAGGGPLHQASPGPPPPKGEEWTAALIAPPLGELSAKPTEGDFDSKRLRVIATTFDAPEAAPAEAIAEAARAVGLAARTAPGLEAALDQALAAPGPAPHVIICGGLHFAGEVLAMSEETWPR